MATAIFHLAITYIFYCILLIVSMPGAPWGKERASTHPRYRVRVGCGRCEKERRTCRVLPLLPRLTPITYWTVRRKSTSSKQRVGSSNLSRRATFFQLLCRHPPDREQPSPASPPPQGSVKVHVLLS